MNIKGFLLFVKNKLEQRSMLRGVALVLLTLVVFGGSYINYKATTEANILEKISSASKIHVLLFLGINQWAIERGITSTALKDASFSGQHRKMIDGIRKASGEIFEKLLLNLKNSRIKKAKTLHSDIELSLKKIWKMRAKADSELLLSLDKRDDGFPMEWFDGFTEIILTREKKFSPILTTLTEPDSKISKIVNLTELVWRVGEYAGRERAAIGMAISSNDNSLPVESLRGYRQTLQNAWKQFKIQQEELTLLASTKESVKKAEKIFFTEFEKTRDLVYYAHKHRDAIPMSNQDWLSKSTNAINSILNVNELLKKEASKLIQSELSNRNFKRNFLILAFLIILLGLLAIIYIHYTNIMNAAKEYLESHKMSSGLHNAAKFWAFERGIIKTTLSRNRGIRKDTLKTIHEKRMQSSEAFAEALQHLEFINLEDKEQLIAKIESEYANIQNRRRQVDAKLAKKKSYEDLANKWFNDFSRLIEKAEELNLIAMRSAGFRLSAVGSIIKSITSIALIKHFCWIMSESAGMERAQIAAAISSKSSLPRRRLAFYRKKFEEGWDTVIKQYNKIKSADGETNNVDEAIADFENIYKVGSGKFGAYRKRIFKNGGCDMKSNGSVCDFLESEINFKNENIASVECLYCDEEVVGGEEVQYETNSLEWFKQSTEAIEAIIFLNDAFIEQITTATEKFKNNTIIQVVSIVTAFIVLQTIIYLSASG